MRELGIPTVVDRLIQQALLQVLQPLIDPTFSEHSYGFRPGRSAHERCWRRSSTCRRATRVVVDVDLEKFFDRVNHDILMDRLAQADRGQAGAAADPRLPERRHHGERGGAVERYEGTPQGGPLSPLLANVLLDEVDQELERRGHRFVRYADDCNVYVTQPQGGRAGDGRCCGAATRKLRLKVNETKSAVASVLGRKFLGYASGSRRRARSNARWPTRRCRRSSSASGS